MTKEIHFLKEMRVAFKLVNILDEKEDSNIEHVDESVQTTSKLGKSRPKKVNTKSSKAKTSTN